MKTRPILFSGPMVRALLDGSKTQTRRVVKPYGADHLFQFRGTTAAAGADEPTGEWAWCGSSHVVNKHICCPYGKPGDRLWVRETFGHPWHHAQPRYFYRASDDEKVGCHPDFDGWKPSIHMPRCASRITLEVTGIRVERLQDISEADAIAEGIVECPIPADEEGPRRIGYMVGPDDGKSGLTVTAREAYRGLWESINGPESWEASPWVWVVEFKRVAPARAA